MIKNTMIECSRQFIEYKNTGCGSQIPQTTSVGAISMAQCKQLCANDPNCDGFEHTIQDALTEFTRSASTEKLDYSGLITDNRCSRFDGPITLIVDVSSPLGVLGLGRSCWVKVCGKQF